MTGVHSRDENASYPAGWQQRRLKLLVSRFFSGGTPSTGHQDYWDGDIPWVSPKDMKSSSISFSADKITELALADTNLPLLDPGHVLMVVRSGILRHSIPIAVNSLPVSINQDIKAMHFCPDIDPFYFRYFVDGLQNHLLNLWRKPGTTVESLEYDYYSEHLVPVPPLDTQRRIVRFLDEKTARIDGLIEKKRALLDRLAEKRQALLTRAVTKGLNPDAAMKPSGIDWLGDIPAHWDVKRFRFTARLISGSTPTTTVPEYWNGEIPWISPKDVKTDELFSSADRVTEYAVSDYGLKLHEDDHAIIVIRGMILARKVPVAVARGRYTINQDMKVIQSKGDVTPEFFQMYLSSIESFLFTLVAEAGHGTKALRTDVLSDVPVLLPPIEEQRSLTATLTRNREETDDAVEKIRSSIEGLAEYRSALITAAVTGQIAELR